jgi:PKD repeat protein
MRVKSWKHLVVVGVILCLVLALDSSYMVGAQGVTVSIDAPAQVSENTDFIARVGISEVTSLDACNYDVTHDPAVLEVTDVTNGIIDGTTIPVDMWGVIAYGTIRVIQNVAGLSGVSGSGYLAEIHFHIIGTAGNTGDIAFSNGMLSDNTANEIPAIWVDDAVYVSTTLDAEFSGSLLEGVAGVTEFTFTDATTGGTPPYTYGWDFDNDGTVDSTDANPTHTYTNAGTYTVTLTMTDSLANTATEIKTGYITIYKPGDANKDGNVNSLDITKVERIIMGLDDPTPGADANGDGNINALDITRIELIIMAS